MAGGLGLLLILLLAAPALAAPEYALSGRAAELQAMVLARTPDGPVTALDVLMLDEMRDRSLGGVPIDAWLKPNALESTPYRPTIRQGLERLLAYRSLAKKAGDWQPAADDVHVKTFGAATAVWTENVVKPQVKVVEITDPASGRISGDIDRFYLAHPEKYLRRLRAQVRTIFLPANMADIEAKNAVREKLDGVARDVQDGKITFEEAARKYSQAPSAAQGGLLPPFYNGTFFDEFDRQTFQLDKPGKISPAFEGPEGYYLVQLVRTWPPRNIPIAEVRDEIRRQLELDDVRHYYNYLLAQLTKKHYVQNYAAQWDYMNLQAPVIQVDSVPLSRPDFLRFFGNPIGTNYETRIADILRDAGAWAEGEIVMEDVQARGLASHPWIERAATLASWPLKAEHYYKTQVSEGAYSSANALKTIRESKQFIQGLRSAHLIEFQVDLKNAAKNEKPAKGPLAGGRQAAAAAISGEGVAMQNKIAAQLAQGTLPTEPTPIRLGEWAAKAGSRPDQLALAIENLQSAIEGTPWPGVRIRVTDKDWVDAVPGTSWYAVLKNVGVGQVSQPVKLGTRSSQYLVLAERPVDMAAWEAKPLLLRTLAFQIEAAKIFQFEVLRVRQAKDVEYLIP
jgi:hypothetical protein